MRFVISHEGEAVVCTLGDATLWLFGVSLNLLYLSNPQDLLAALCSLPGTNREPGSIHGLSSAASRLSPRGKWGGGGGGGHKHPPDPIGGGKKKKIK